MDYLGLLPNVDRERIGILGICGWGGFALNAAIADPRIKAVATDRRATSRVCAKGYNDRMDANARYETKKKLAEQCWADAAAGKPAYTGAIKRVPQR